MGIIHQETKTGTRTSVGSNVTVASNVAAANSLYLCAVNNYGDNSSTPTLISSIAGGTGLTWATVKSGCSGRIQNPHSEVWWAYGSPGSNFTVTVTFASNINRASAAVSRYTGTKATIPIGAAYENTNGLNGTCGGGSDNGTPNLDLTSVENSSMLYVLTHFRNATLDTEDSEYTQRAFVSNSSGGDGATLYVHEKLLSTAGMDNCAHTGSARPWVMTGCVIEEAAATSPTGQINQMII